MHDDPDIRRRAREQRDRERVLGRIHDGHSDEEQDTSFVPEDDRDEDEREDRELDMGIRAPSPDVEVEDADHDAYFEKYGQVAESVADERLQGLAKARLQAGESERKRLAREKREQRRFLLVMEREIEERRLVEEEKKKTLRREARERKRKEEEVRLAQRAQFEVSSHVAFRSWN